MCRYSCSCVVLHRISGFSAYYILRLASSLCFAYFTFNCSKTFLFLQLSTLFIWFDSLFLSLGEYSLEFVELCICLISPVLLIQFNRFSVPLASLLYITLFFSPFQTEFEEFLHQFENPVYIRFSIMVATWLINSISQKTNKLVA